MIRDQQCGLLNKKNTGENSYSDGDEHFHANKSVFVGINCLHVASVN